MEQRLESPDTKFLGEFRDEDEGNDDFQSFDGGDGISVDFKVEEPEDSQKEQKLNEQKQNKDDEIEDENADDFKSAEEPKEKV